MLFSLGKKIGYWLLPTFCPLCLSPVPLKASLCSACTPLLTRNDTACPSCAAPLAISGLCGQCQQHPPAFSHTVAIFNYTAPVDRLIQGFKYHRKLNQARILGEIMAAALAKIPVTPNSISPSLLRPEVIIPVPLHVSRLRERGYNQALELARPIARKLALPLDYRSVIRVRKTAPQIHLSLKLRERNVRNAFALTDKLPYKHIALIDDVMTTGYTLNALALCLRNAGAETIQAWVLARA